LGRLYKQSHNVRGDERMNIIVLAKYTFVSEGKEPKGKILMERTLENSRKFQALYYYFLRGMFLIK